MTRALAAAVAASVLLVGAYLALGGGGQEVARPPDPCRAASTTPSGAQGLSGGLERVALTALSSAACDLRTTRERLVLAVGGVRPLPPGIDVARRDAAIRAGVGRALDEEQRAGRISPTEAQLLRTALNVVPVDAVLDQLLGRGGGGAGAGATPGG